MRPNLNLKSVSMMVLPTCLVIVVYYLRFGQPLLTDTQTLSAEMSDLNTSISKLESEVLQADASLKGNAARRAELNAIISAGVEQNLLVSRIGQSRSSVELLERVLDILAEQRLVCHSIQQAIGEAEDQGKDGPVYSIQLTGTFASMLAALEEIRSLYAEVLPIRLSMISEPREASCEWEITIRFTEAPL